MSIKIAECVVDNGDGIEVDIRLDSKWLIDDEQFFDIDQDGNNIVVTLECLRNLVKAAERLLKDNT